MINYESAEQSERNDVVVYDVKFQGRTLKTLEFNGEKWVAMRPVVEGMGIDWKGQHAKLVAQHDRFMCGDISTHDSSGRKQVMVCLPLRKYHSWLTTINPNKVPDLEVRARIVLFQEASAEVLYQFWTKGRADKESVFTDQLLDRVKDLIEDMHKSHATDVAMAVKQNEVYLKNFVEGAMGAVVRGVANAFRREVCQAVSILQKQIDDLALFSKERFGRAYNRDMDSRSALDEIARKIDRLSSGSQSIQDDQAPESTSHRRTFDNRPENTVSMHDALVSLGVEESFMQGRLSGLARSMTNRAKHWFRQRNYAIYPQGEGFSVYFYEKAGVEPWWNAQGKTLYEAYVTKHALKAPGKHVVRLALRPSGFQTQKGNQS